MHRPKSLESCLAVIAVLVLTTTASHSGALDRFFKKGAQSDDKVAAGLKEALDVGTRNTVTSTSKVDGYFKNEAIKILMPDQLQKLDKGLRAVGLGADLDAFVLSMNRAAERAAPAAKAIFKDALTKMTFSDAKKILSGGDTAATDFFRSRTSEPITAAFLPVVSSALNEVGATKQYKALVGRFSSLPFMKSPTLDLDQYVTGKALAGMFLVLGEEEKKIRKDPAARVTSLLKEVFANPAR